MNLLIEKVIKIFFKKYNNNNFYNYYFILPNKYYINITKQIYIKNKIYGNIPNIFLSKKYFLEKISNLKIIDNKLYFFKILYNNIKNDKEIKNIYLYKIIKWVYTLFYDFNIIDSELIDIKKFFKYNIYSYKISKWYPNKYINNIKKSFQDWEYIYKCYKILKKKLLKKKKSYLGLARRIAYINIDRYLNENNKNFFIIIGNNYFTKSEKKIIEKILKKKLGYFYFDIDLEKKYNNKYYILKNKNFKNKIKLIKTFNKIDKYIVASNLIKKNQKTSIILNNNNKILLNYISQNINKINILIYDNFNNLNIHKFFISIFNLIINKKKYIYKKKKIVFFNKELLIDFFNNFFIKFLIKNNNIINYLNKTNSKYIFLKKIKNIIKEKILLNLIIINNNNCLEFIYLLKIIINILYIKNNNLEYIDNIYLDKLFFFNTFFLKFLKKNKTLKKNIKINILYKIYIFYIKKNKIKINNNYFKSNLEILNIKNLILNNYNNVIIILSKKKIYKKTYISYEIQKKFNLNFKLNEEIYIYKINKLLNLSKKIFIIYNHKNIITKKILKQIINNKKYNISKTSYKNKYINFSPLKKNIEIEKKTYNIIKKLKYLKNNGFTFTLIKNYINNPILFYYNNILNLYNDNNIFLGSIIHKILYSLYKNYININLNINHIKNIKNNINNIIDKKIYKFYDKKKIIIDNKLLYIYNIIRKNIKNFIFCDEKLILNGNNINIYKLEKKYKKKIKLNKNNFTFIKGKIDRIDKLNNNYRIIDYKINFKSYNSLIFKKKNNLDVLFKKKKYKNLLQLLIYCLIFFKKKNKYIYSSIYLPYKKSYIKNVKINNNNKIYYKTINKLKYFLSKKILEILNINKNFLGDYLYF
ncbi:MAG: PD-(D/E)XK nuclease family protein [Candidatus Shikimatogenerans bostrichidophilus]|nr:MAG: PD-(D/E)XK nuclease family protein [Candidatus Shikimatogenerans bostrichidophilus]